MASRIAARFDPELVARIVDRRVLSYSAGPDPSLDRPAHVRAGSGLAAFGDRLVVVQDDASFVALVDPRSGRVDAVPLPAGADGARQFDDTRRNKAAKPDFEACVVCDVDGVRSLLAFGSGSTERRERVAVVPLPADGALPVRLARLSLLYDAFRRDVRFSGSELNVEGAVLLGGVLRFFQRGNGKATAEREPVNATADVALEDVLDELEGRASEPPVLRSVIQYDLGRIDGIRLTFTDAAAGPRGAVAYLAAAEDSPDAVQDGRVVGAAVGVISGDQCRATRLVDSAECPVTDKVEGLVLDAEDPGRGYVVIDADDPALPSVLCRIELSGPWF